MLTSANFTGDDFNHFLVDEAVNAGLYVFLSDSATNAPFQATHKVTTKAMIFTESPVACRG